MNNKKYQIKSVMREGICCIELDYLIIKNLNNTDEEFIHYPYSPVWLLMDDQTNLFIKIEAVGTKCPPDLEIEFYVTEEKERKYLIIKEKNLEEAKVPITTTAITSITMEIYGIEFTPVMFKEGEIRRSDDC